MLKVIVLAKEGYMRKQIAEMLRCNQSTVARILQRRKDTGSTNHLPRNGRPWKTLQTQDSVFGTLAKLIATWRHWICFPNGLKKEIEMFRRCQHEWRARRKQPLTKFPGVCQLTCAKEHWPWTVEQRQQLISSDESHFCLYENWESQYVWRFLHETLRPDCVSVTVK